MHNGVRYDIEGHDVEVVRCSSMIAMNPNGCIHNSNSYMVWELRVDGKTIAPPPMGDSTLFNIRCDGFDTHENAFVWAWSSITDDRIPSHFSELDALMSDHLSSVS